MPVSTMWALRNFDASTADPASLRAAIRIPESLEPRPGGVTLEVGWWRDGDEAKHDAKKEKGGGCDAWRLRHWRRRLPRSRSRKRAALHHDVSEDRGSDWLPDAAEGRRSTHAHPEGYERRRAFAALREIHQQSRIRAVKPMSAPIAKTRRPFALNGHRRDGGTPIVATARRPRASNFATTARGGFTASRTRSRGSAPSAPDRARRRATERA